MRKKAARAVAAIMAVCLSAFPVMEPGVLSVAVTAADGQMVQDKVRITETEIEAEQVSNMEGYAYITNRFYISEYDFYDEKHDIYDRTGALTPYRYDEWSSTFYKDIQVCWGDSGTYFGDAYENPIEALSWDHLFGELLPEREEERKYFSEADVIQGGYVAAGTPLYDGDEGYEYSKELLVIVDESGNVLKDIVVDSLDFMTREISYIGNDVFAIMSYQPETDPACNDVNYILDMKGNEWDVTAIDEQIQQQKCGDHLAWIWRAQEGPGLRIQYACGSFP